MESLQTLSITLYDSYLLQRWVCGWREERESGERLSLLVLPFLLLPCTTFTLMTVLLRLGEYLGDVPFDLPPPDLTPLFGDFHFGHVSIRGLRSGSQRGTRLSEMIVR